MVVLHFSPKIIPMTPVVMISPSLIESPIFFSVKTSHLLYKFLIIRSKKNYIFHIGKDIKHANEVDVINALCCPTPAALSA